MYRSEKEKYEYIKQKIKDFVPTPEYLEKLRKDREDYEAYMELDKHEGNCHCYRCMSEFLSRSNK